MDEGELQHPREASGAQKRSQRAGSLELATAEWVDWWNQRRLHSADGDLPPAEYEALYHRQRDTTDVA